MAKALKPKKKNNRCETCAYFSKKKGFCFWHNQAQQPRSRSCYNYEFDNNERMEGFETW